MSRGCILLVILAVKKVLECFTKKISLYEMSFFPEPYTHDKKNKSKLGDVAKHEVVKKT